LGRTLVDFIIAQVGLVCALVRSPSLVFYMIDSSHIKLTLPAHAGQPADES
jgi:hypothetical protein